MKIASVFVLSGCLASVAFCETPDRAANPPQAALPVRAPATPSAAKFVEVLATADTLRLLQAGGYALYLRHGTTDNAIPDRMPAVDLKDCSTQRPLTEAGRQLMVKVGEYIRQAGIPVGELHVSPMCRARQSVAAAFPKRVATVDKNLMYVANFTSEEKAPIIAQTRKLLSTPVAKGSNRLLLAHAPNLMDLMAYFPKEATLVIFKPKGEADGFEYLASVPPSAWPGLLK